jgi:hypothetical protein
MEFTNKSKYIGIFIASIFVGYAIISGYSKIQVIVLGSGLLFTMIVLTNFTKTNILLLMIALLMGLNLFNYTDVRLSYPYLRYSRMILIFISLIVIVATQNRHDLKFHRANWDVYLLGLWGVVCSFFAIDRTDSLLYSVWLLLSYVIIVETVASFDQKDLLLKKLITIFALVSGSFVIWSFASKGYKELTPITSQFAGMEGEFGARTSFGATCTLAFASSLAFLQNGRSRSYIKAFFNLTLVGSLAGSIVSLCRASWLATSVCAAFYASIKGKGRRTKYALVILSLVGLFAVTWFTNMLPSSFTSAVERRIEFTNAELRGITPVEQARRTIWIANLEYAAESPVFGSGIGCSGRIFHFIDPFYSSIFLLSSDLGYGPHNSYLQILVETGIVGFALFIVILIRTAASIKRWEALIQTRDAVLLVLSAIMVNSFFESYAFLPGGLFFWPFWTLLIAVRNTR